jgi:hypothetical protein
MSFPTTITPAILDPVLGQIAPHFLVGANNDLPTARQAASHILDAYNVATEEELQLAADIVSLGCHMLEALSEAALDPSSNKKIRLRGSAVSLSREAHKARRKLDQLQRARRMPAPQVEAQAPAPDTAKTDQAADLVEFARQALTASTRQGGLPAFNLNRQQRRAAERITENLKRNKAEQARREAKLAAANAMIPAEIKTPQAAAVPSNT